MSSFVWPPSLAGGGGTGTVTSIALVDGSNAPIYDITGSPITTSGSLTFTLKTEAANLIFAGPTTGVAAQPTFRSLVSADISALFGNLTDAGTDGIVVTGGTGVVLGTGTSIAQHVADTTHNGYLSSTDWNTFNGKQNTVTIGNFAGTSTAKGLDITSDVISLHAADGTNPGAVSTTTQTFAGQKTFSTGLTGTLTGAASLNVLTSALGNLTDVGTDGIVVTGGTAAVVGAVSLAQHVADTTHNGYLSSTDWNTFNGKITNPMTTLGDIIYENGGPAATRLAGNTTSTNKFLTQTGTGSISAAPAWATIQPSDLPNPTASTLGGIESYAAVSNQWINTISTSGVPSSTQPAFSNISGSPTYAQLATNLKVPTIQQFTSTGTQVGWLFTVTGWTGTIVAGDTYTNNGHTYTAQQITQTNGASGQTLFMSGTGATSGTTLTKGVSASGPGTITFSATVATALYTTPTSPGPLYIRVRAMGDGGGGGGGGSSGGGNGGTGVGTFFGPNILIAAGGGGGGKTAGTPGSGGAATVNSPAAGLALTGGSGAPGTNNGNTLANDFGLGGNGGSGPLGGAGYGGPFGSAGQNGVANTGGGAGGGGGGSAVDGGSGGGSGAHIDALITSPVASYPYAIGTGGANGGAGTGGSAGGTGGTGLVIVEEHYQ